MIHIHIVFYAQFRMIHSLECWGHAKGEYGKNILCASVSILVRTFLYCLEKNKKITQKNIQEGLIQAKFLPASEGYTEFLIQGLEDLRNEYSDEIELCYEIGGLDGNA